MDLKEERGGRGLSRIKITLGYCLTTDKEDSLCIAIELCLLSLCTPNWNPLVLVLHCGTALRDLFDMVHCGILKARSEMYWFY